MDPLQIAFLRNEFLRNEFLTLTLLGALGRSNTYLKSALEEERVELRDKLRAKLKDVGTRYMSPVDDSSHVANICEIADEMTSQFSRFLKRERFRIGIAQKALNLYLKYLWCLGEIPAPPHCPFDSIVIAHLPKERQRPWTSIDKAEDYMALVGAARVIAGESSQAEWELKVWNEGKDSGAQL